jgi:gamma-glutamylcyclotransferase (GGCT)/AIG2-like uncharacterized protein YtfP
MPDPMNTKAASPAPRHVFVYGTLRRGDDNDINKLSPAPRYIGEGHVQGVMYHLGAYPGVILADVTAVAAGSEGAVLGEVYAVDPELERVLDEIEELYPQEKDEYFKRTISVAVGLVQLDCFVYEINPAYIQGKPVIASGDWVRSRWETQSRTS